MSNSYCKATKADYCGVVSVWIYSRYNKSLFCTSHNPICFYQRHFTIPKQEAAAAK